MYQIHKSYPPIVESLGKKNDRSKSEEKRKPRAQESARERGKETNGGRRKRRGMEGREKEGREAIIPAVCCKSERRYPTNGRVRARARVLTKQRI